MSIKRISVLNLCHVLKPFVKSTPAPHLTKVLNRQYRNTIANLRLSSHPLLVETRRYTRVPREEMRCVYSNTRVIADEYHFVIRSMTGILEQLKWETLKKRRRDRRLILLYKGLKGKASVPTDDLIPKNHHSMTYEVPIANIDIYKCSFSSSPLGIAMRFQTLLTSLLRVPRTVLLRSLLW